jgi:superkiller protein 3
MLEGVVEVLKAYPNHPECYLLLGDAYSMLGNLSLAIECYRNAVLAGEEVLSEEWHSDDVAAQVDFEPDAAKPEDIMLKLFEILSSIGISAQALCNIGRIEKERGNKHDSIEAYEKASSVMSRCVQTLYSASISYADEERFADAVAVLEKCVHLDADFAEAWGLLGICYFELNRPTDSVAACKRAKALRPDLTDLQLFIGLSYQKLESYPQAVEALEDAVSIDPESAEAHGSLGMLWLNMGETRRAIQALTQAVEIDPEYPEAYYSLALAHFMEGNFDKGHELMEFLRMWSPEGYDDLLPGIDYTS